METTEQLDLFNPCKCKRRIVVGLTGKARSGKDTFANVLVRDFGFRKLSLADPLKDGLAAMMGISRAELDQRKEDGDTYIRHCLQTLGTEWGRNMIDDDIWVQMLSDRIKALGDQDVVIADVRFDNEALYLRRVLGAKLLQLYRPGTASIHGSTHASEAGIDLTLVTQVLVNDGSQAQWEALAHIWGAYETAQSWVLSDSGKGD